MAKKLWGGRFSKATDPLVEKFTSSINIDQELALYDVLGSLAHVKVLKEAKLISLSEYNRITGGLNSILTLAKSGKLKIDYSSEDIHSDIQNKLEKKIGSVAKKLHTSRSRNDQVVFDVKLYCKNACKDICLLIDSLEKSIKSLATKNKNVILPGYTHLQHAQPLKLSQYLLAYIFMLGRDKNRVKSASQRIVVSLGSGALSGTNIAASCYAKALKASASKLGLSFGKDLKVAESSVDNVSDRDFIVDILSALALIGMHLSRMSEDLIAWSSSEFGFIDIDDSFCTGSSLMPQKKNPDVLELIRGCSGKLYGNLTSVLVMMKGLPLTYNRDMQLDKEPLFSSINIVKEELAILAKLILGIKFKKDKIKEQLSDELLYATDLAHYLVEKKVAFKDAHKIIGNLVSFSLKHKVALLEMSEGQLRKFSKYLNKQIIKKIISAEQSVAAKKSTRGRV